MATHVRMFKSDWAPAVKEGTKLTTLRPKGRVVIKAGDFIKLCQWEGKPRQSKVTVLNWGRVTVVEDVTVTDLQLLKNEKELTDAEALAMAKADGFKTVAAFRKFFKSEHGLPFSGNLIHWVLTTDRPPEPTKPDKKPKPPVKIAHVRGRVRFKLEGKELIAELNKDGLHLRWLHNKRKLWTPEQLASLTRKQLEFKM